MAEGARLESVYAVTYREFESLPLCYLFFVFCKNKINYSLFRYQYMKKHLLVLILLFISFFGCFAQVNLKIDSTKSTVAQATVTVVDTTFVPVKLATISDTEAFKMGMKDAQDRKNYRDGAGAISFLGAAILSPLYGIVPMAVYSVRKPDKKYFNYPTNAPINQKAYTKGFEKKALQLRKARALTGYSIATAGWTAFISLIIYSFNGSNHH